MATALNSPPLLFFHNRGHNQITWGTTFLWQHWFPALYYNSLMVNYSTVNTVLLQYINLYYIVHVLPLVFVFGYGHLTFFYLNESFFFFFFFFFFLRGCFVHASYTLHCRNKPWNETWLHTWSVYTVVSHIMASMRYGPKRLLRQNGYCMF